MKSLRSVSEMKPEKPAHAPASDRLLLLDETTLQLRLVDEAALHEQIAELCLEAMRGA